MSRYNYALQIIEQCGVDKPTAEMIVERLGEEGMLHTGYGNLNVDQVCDAFKDSFGTTKTSKYDRFAANRLATKYGAESVVTIIKLLSQNQADRFAPTVNNVTEVEAKWVSVMKFLRGVTPDEITLE